MDVRLNFASLRSARRGAFSSTVVITVFSLVQRYSSNTGSPRQPHQQEWRENQRINQHHLRISPSNRRLCGGSVGTPLSWQRSLSCIFRGEGTMPAGPWRSEGGAGHTACCEEPGNVVLGGFHVPVGHLAFFTCATTSTHLIRTVVQLRVQVKWEGG